MRVACFLFSEKISLAEFAQACLRFSPQIALREPNAIFLEIGRCKKIYSEATFLARAQVLLRRFNCSAKIALSDRIPTALSFAQYGVSEVDSLPIEAILNFMEPFNDRMTTRGSQQKENLKRGEKMVDAFKRLGIHHLSEFKKLPTQQFPSRFGSLGLYCRQQVESQQPDLWPYWIPPEHWFENVEMLDSDYCYEIEPLIFKAKSVLDRLFSRLKGASLRVDRLELVMRQEKYSTVLEPLRKWVFEFIVPQGSTSGVLPIIRERLSWDLAQSPIQSSIIELSVEALTTSPGRDLQRNFFNLSDDLNEKMGSVFGQLEELLGEGQVFWASMTENRFPEKSWIKTKAVQQIASNELSLKERYPLRPTRILAAPVSISILQNKMSLKGRVENIKSFSPVERISSDWLDDFPPRNYHLIQLEQGTVLWVFQDSKQHYFLHGYYE